jgi:ribosomal protein S18 acetylase RimI-like enzyme
MIDFATEPLRVGSIRASDAMKITAATTSDLDQTIACLVASFAQDPITGFLLQTGPGYEERLTRFFSLLMQARIALGMPVIVAREATGIHGAVMGYTTEHPAWPTHIAEDWDRFEHATPGLVERMAVYDDIAAKGKPEAPHYYLGVIGTDPGMQGLGIGRQLLQSFCDQSAGDPRSHGVYLETAKQSNLRFYERAGFVETARENLGSATLWCMYMSHGSR